MKVQAKKGVLILSEPLDPQNSRMVEELFRAGFLVEETGEKQYLPGEDTPRQVVYLVSQAREVYWGYAGQTHFVRR